ncbi:MAG: response regulator [Rhodanobacter sp.]
MKVQPIVLVLDDDSAVLTALSDSLESQASFQLLVAQTYSAASKMIAINPVDIIVADVLLAGEATGIDFCNEAIGRYPNVALVLVSADMESHFKSYPLRAAWLRKPFGVAELLDAIADARAAVNLCHSQSE